MRVESGASAATSPFLQQCGQPTVWLALLTVVALSAYVEALSRLGATGPALAVDRRGALTP